MMAQQIIILPSYQLFVFLIVKGMIQNGFVLEGQAQQEQTVFQNAMMG